MSFGLPISEYIISYQAITGNNNVLPSISRTYIIISYQAITGNNNLLNHCCIVLTIISYQAITGNNNHGRTA